jgi:hypothetical protein
MAILAGAASSQRGLATVSQMPGGLSNKVQGSRRLGGCGRTRQTKAAHPCWSLDLRRRPCVEGRLVNMSIP